MSTYAIGDIQGCYDDLRHLLDDVQFDPSHDTIWFTGDLINRGPQSLDVLRFVKSLGKSAVTVLGNHDLHVLCIHYGFQAAKDKDRIKPLLNAPDREELMTWLRHLPIMHRDEKLNHVMVHAGILPGWSVAQAATHAKELERVLRGNDHLAFFEHMYGNEPCQWDESLTGWDRMRFITNSFTRMRFCSDPLTLLLDFKGHPDDAPSRYKPWYQLRDAANEPCIVFGHWSMLGLLDETHVRSLDTGCLWGGQLTAQEIGGEHRLFQRSCPLHMNPIAK